MRRPLVALVTLVLGSGAAFACYDVDVLRGGARPTTSVAPPAVDASVAGARAGFCATVPDALLCDDFDDPEEVAFARWRGVDGMIPGVLVQGDAGLWRSGGDAAPPSPPNALDLTLASDEARTTVLLSAASRPKREGFVELSAAFRLLEASLGDGLSREGGAADVLRPQVAVLALGAVGVRLVGATLLLSPDSLELRAGAQINEIQGTSRVTFSRASYDRLLRDSWGRIHLAVGARQAVTARATGATGAEVVCPASAAVAAAWTDLVRGAAACIPLEDGVVPVTERDFIAVVGGTVDERSVVHEMVDDVILQDGP